MLRNKWTKRKEGPRKRWSTRAPRTRIKNTVYVDVSSVNIHLGTDRAMMLIRVTSQDAAMV